MSNMRTFVTLAAVAVLLTGCSATTATPETTASTSPSSVTKTSATPATPAAPAVPALTVSQKVVDAAQGYLAKGYGFSRQDLIDQLSSADGDAFPLADATAAVDSLKADYNAQAVRAAKIYFGLGSNTHASLVSVLTSPGPQFTPEQAEYAATKLGL